MSRTRIVNGKYTKIIKGDYRMFSEGNIASSAAKQYFEKGEDGGIILEDPKMYEPWKEKDIYSKYIGYLCYSVNSKRPLPDDLGLNIDVNTFLTGICSAIKFEAYNINDESEFSLYNWMYIFNILLDNRGEIRDVVASSITYNANLQSGENRAVKNVNKCNYATVSKGKALHDEILLDKKLYLQNYTREIDYTGDLSQDQFFNRMAAYAEEASRLNRKKDVSYSFFIANKDSEDLLADIAGTSAAHDYPFLTELVKNKSFTMMKEVQGFFGYIFDDLLGAKAFVESLDSFRGPFLLEPILVTRHNGEVIAEMEADTSDYIKRDLELLNVKLNQ